VVSPSYALSLGQVVDPDWHSYTFGVSIPVMRPKMKGMVPTVFQVPCRGTWFYMVGICPLQFCPGRPSRKRAVVEVSLGNQTA
jgi:hypothetical protein